MVSEQKKKKTKLLRKQIIRHQALREAPRLMEGSGPTSRTEPLRPAAPSTINKDSINFTAARQQFLKLEQERACVLLKPGSFSNTHMKAPPPEEKHPCRLAHDLDSGLDGLSAPSSVEAAWSSHLETPIQREIRLIQQREENLRLARGLKVSTAEMVEIKSKRFQSPLSLSSKDLQPVLQKMQRKDKHQLQADVQEENHLDPGDTARKAGQNKRREERPPSGDTTDFPSPCCPHRHPEERQPDICHRTSDTDSLPEDTRRFHPDGMASPVDTSAPSMLTMDTPRSWRENLQLNGLQSRNSGAPDFIEKEIEEALRREEELQELRAPRDDSSPQACSPATQAPRRAESLFQPTGSGRNITSSPSHGPIKRLSSISLITAQPWTSSPSSLLSSSTLAGQQAAPPAVRGLTDTESSYAGILRWDHINQELVESTRVTRHKNQRALLWEAGVFTNQADQ